MMLGTQWYILFNVVAGAMAIPADLREAARSFNIVGWLRWWKLYVPAIFPSLVTGWVVVKFGKWFLRRKAKRGQLNPFRRRPPAKKGKGGKA